MFFKEYIGSKEFLLKTAAIAIPLMIQQVLAGAMGIVDTIMVSSIGMVSAVGTAAQIDMICNMINYGIVGGTGMFTSQFYGGKNYDDLKKSFGLSIIMTTLNGIFWFLMVTFFGKQILSFYIKDEFLIENAYKYLNIIKYYYIINGFSHTFAYTFRSIKKTKLTFKVSLVSMCTNTILNYLLINGIGVFPRLEVRGAAVATIAASIVSFIIYYSYARYTKQHFLGTIKENFYIPISFFKRVIKKVLPLVVNETAFAFGTTLFVKAFGVLGKTSMDAYYVSLQISNLFMYVIYGYGGAIQVLLGNILGKGDIERAKRESKYHFGLSFLMMLVLASCLIIFARPLVSFFNLKDPVVFNLAVYLLYVFAIKLCMRLFNFVIFSILRSGGDAAIIQFLDSGIVWLVGVPLAFISVNILRISSIVVVLLITQLEQFVRLVLGLRRVSTYKWAKNLNVKGV